MRTCFNTITAGPDAPLDEIITACGQAGYAGLEIDQEQLGRLLERLSPEAVTDLLAAHHLEVAAVMAFDLDPFGDAAQGGVAMRQGADLARAVGAPLLLTYCAAAVPAGMAPDEARAQAGRRAALYADAVAPLRVALEPIGGTTLMGGPAEALAIARLSGRPNVGIMMDTFHYYVSGVSADALRAIPRDDLLIVHINDAEDRPRAQLRDEHRLYPGHGILPLQEDLRLLREIGYDGFVSVEIFRPEYWAQPVAQVVHDSKAALDDVLSRAGVTS